MTTHSSDVINRRQLIKKTIVSWHLLSLASLVLFFSLSVATSSSMDQDVSNSIDTETSLGVLAATTPASSASNSSEETHNTRAANCSVNVEDVCRGNENDDCNLLKAECIICDFNTSCQYGTKQKARCTPKPNVNCSGDQVFEREYECRYCYQLPPWLTICSNQTTDCALNKPRQYHPARPFFVSTCWAKSEHLCMGRRCFHKQLPCNWSQGYKWSTAMLLSIFLGGFGVDRFYLGLWREGIGKLLSFGGLGVWTLVDVILIAVGYIGPWDGSLYI